VTRVHRDGGDGVGHVQDAVDTLQHKGRMPDGEAIGRDDRETVLRLQLEGPEPGLLKRLSRRDDPLPYLDITLAQESEPDGRVLAEVPGTHRRHRRHARGDPGVEQAGERLGQSQAGARAAARDAHEPSGHRGPDDFRRQRVAHSAGVHRDQLRLEGADVLDRHPLVAGVTDERVQAVYRFIALEGGFHHSPAGFDGRDGVRAERDVRTSRHRYQLVQRRRCVGDDHLSHPTSLAAGPVHNGRRRAPRQCVSEIQLDVA
jgi:hypothetical protein